MSRTVDFWPTPAWCAHEGARLAWTYSKGGRVLDPCAGTGVLLDAFSSFAPFDPCAMTGVELDAGLAAQSEHYPINTGDSLTDRPWPKADVVLMNPPFSRAEAFVERSRKECPVTVALLRLGFLASRKRREFFAGHPLPDVYVLAKRPSFAAKGKTDSSEYAWIVWAPTARGQWHRIEVAS